ncbi:MAG TPA: tail fiber protein [Reyranella sp.]|jgi:microcystin-dependent protein|nr:tail fiber protein [Reyranella sp.]
MATPFVGQIISVGFDFAPLGWFPCDGRTLQISDYQLLYTIIGTTYGGGGVTDFALPNLNGRVPLGIGQGQGLSNYVQGQVAGTESVTLLSGNTPPHTHTLNFSATAATGISPKAASGTLAVGTDVNGKLKGFYADKAGTVALRPGTITPFVGGQPHENRQQYLVLNYIIAWAGVYPSRPS